MFSGACNSSGASQWTPVFGSGDVPGLGVWEVGSEFMVPGLRAEGFKSLGGGQLDLLREMTR